LENPVASQTLEDVCCAEARFVTRVTELHPGAAGKPCLIGNYQAGWRIRDLNSFVQAYGSKRLDASLLLIPLVGFLPATDPRVRGTLGAIESKLLVDGEFVLRYEADNPADGLPAGEGAFLACSFWLVDNYVLQRRYAEAHKLFARLLSRCNDVGLLAEEFYPLTGRMLGNFPQAYSHVGLINCALSLSRQKGPADELLGQL
jgi:GH15 family glucan-1,4-alpha-glucosidase